MNDITTLNYEGNNVRMVDKDGEPWWVMKDVAEILGIKNSRDIVARLDEDEKGVDLIDTPGGRQNMTIINESGLYAVILRSDKPQARPFRKWVTSEVLPSIRKTGSYKTEPTTSETNRTQQELNIRELEARAKVADVLYKLLDVETLSENYKNILVCKVAEAACGTPVLPLPKRERVTYSAGEVGAMLGISGQKVGRIANQHDMKTEEYGEWYRDKAAHSSKEVDTFRYFENAVEKFRSIIGDGDAVG